MSHSEIEHLLASFLALPHETEHIEFKEAKRSFDSDELGKYFSALSNEANLNNQDCAWLLFGVRNDHTVCGTTYRDNPNKLDSLKQEVANHTNGGITFIGIYEYRHPDGRVVMFKIPPAVKNVPTSWKGHWYGRNGESLSPLSMSEIDRIRSGVPSNQSPTSIVDARIASELRDLLRRRLYSDFDALETANTLARRILSGNLSAGSDETKKRALAWCSRLIARTPKPNNANSYLEVAQAYGDSPEIQIAKAIISSANGNEDIALRMLAHVDSRLSRSAAFIVVTHHRGPAAAIKWLSAAGLNFNSLDSEGKYVLLTCLHHEHEWSYADETIHTISNTDYLKTPPLHHLVAITDLISVVPEELRPVLARQIPLFSKDFPLSANPNAMERRARSRGRFADAAAIARDLGFEDAAESAEEYALWLDLHDHDRQDDAINTLKSKLQDPSSGLRYVPLAVDYGVSLNAQTVEEQIDRQLALTGKMTPDAAAARLCLAFLSENPRSIASYIAHHRNSLTNHIAPQVLASMEIMMLANAGLIAEAHERLEAFRHTLSETELESNRRLIASREDGTTVTIIEAQFATTNSLADLAQLVSELENSDDVLRMCRYSQILFSRTGSIPDAERMVRAFLNAGRYTAIVDCFRDKQPLRMQSRLLQMAFCLSLYNEGALLDCHSELLAVEAPSDDPNYRNLRMKVAIAIGDWDSLSTYVESEYTNRANSNAEHLMVAADLAIHMKLPRAKALLHAAALSAPDNPEILARAYSLATSAGWENEAKPVNWLKRAVSLSGDAGPIQQITFDEFLTKKSGWDRNANTVWEKLLAGEVPMFLAAQGLNSSLVNLMLFPAFTNLNTLDPRRRAIVPAYSGLAQVRQFSTVNTIALDSSALLTLGYLDIVDLVLSSFRRIYLPHSTLTWLFEERHRASFHQPTRIRAAHRLMHLIITGSLTELAATAIPDGSLIDQVGEELAQLLAEVTKEDYDSESSAYVVRPNPVYSISSLSQEPVDLSSYHSVLIGCEAVLDYLRTNGQITARDYSIGVAYLSAHEGNWPNQPAISHGATLYLDHLAVSHLLHLNVLDKLAPAGLTAVIARQVSIDANELIQHEHTIDRVTQAIDKIRRSLETAITSGKAILQKGEVDNATPTPPEETHPSSQILGLAKYCDALIVDDRFVNRLVTATSEPTLPTILTTLELLDILRQNGDISYGQWLEHRTALRRSGYAFLPVDIGELTSYFEATRASESAFVETAELKAIRENLLQVRMTKFLQLPTEGSWIDSLIHTFLRVLKSQWVPGLDVQATTARSNWLLQQIDVRGWAHFLTPSEAEGRLPFNISRFVLELAKLPDGGIEGKTRVEFWRWIEGVLLRPIKERYPKVYSLLVADYRSIILDLANSHVDQGGARDE